MVCIIETQQRLYNYLPFHVTSGISYANKKCFLNNFMYFIIIQLALASPCQVLFIVNRNYWVKI